MYDIVLCGYISERTETLNIQLHCDKQLTSLVAVSSHCHVIAYICIYIEPETHTHTCMQ